MIIKSKNVLWQKYYTNVIRGNTGCELAKEGGENVAFCNQFRGCQAIYQKRETLFHQDIQTQRRELKI